jgi:hypothetical protein
LIDLDAFTYAITIAIIVGYTNVHLVAIQRPENYCLKVAIKENHFRLPNGKQKGRAISDPALLFGNRISTYFFAFEKKRN